LRTCLGQLTNLQVLDLVNNRLKSIPPELAQLTNLQRLYLQNNQLSSIPPELAQLTNLQALGLSSNQVTLMPDVLGRLTNLQILDLTSNQLTSVPPELAELTNLQRLYLDDNGLTQLPEGLGELTNLTEIRLDGNPLESPLPEVVMKGTIAIINYLHQLQKEGRDRVYEAKLLIVGEAGAGKTSFAKKVQDPAYELTYGEKSTEGIDIIEWHFSAESMEGRRDFRVNIWDFGGQEIYHATHQFFLTKRSLYALVADTRKEDTDFYYWLNVVELLSAASPLLIIKNEKQDRHREINESALRGEFGNIKERF
jgi:internalin A